MKQLIFLLTLLLIPFLIKAQTRYGTATGAGGGVSSSYFGHQAGRLVTEGQRWNTLVGYRTGYSLVSSDNPDNNIGRTNSFFGALTGLYTTTGNSNTFIGQAAGKNNTIGNSNTFVGKSAGFDNESGLYNTYLGTNAGYKSTESFNTYLGMNAGYNNVNGSNNVFIGINAGYFETGGNKLIIDSKTTNSDVNTPLVYGDFEDHYVGIAINPSTDIVNTNLYGLYVGKGILAEKVRIATPGTTDWSDYVFEVDYDLNTIEEVEQFVKENKHLPNVPSAAEVTKNGVDVVKMDATLLRQIEELWLHMIEVKKENEALKEEVVSSNNTNKDIADIKEINKVLLEQIEELKSYTVKLNERIQELKVQQDK